MVVEIVRYRTDLPPLTLAIVLLEETLVVRNAVFAGDEAIAGRNRID